MNFRINFIIPIFGLSEDGNRLVLLYILTRNLTAEATNPRLEGKLNANLIWQFYLETGQAYNIWKKEFLWDGFNNKYHHYSTLVSICDWRLRSRQWISWADQVRDTAVTFVVSFFLTFFLLSLQTVSSKWLKKSLK